MKKIYHEQKKSQGSASLMRIYMSKVPSGKYLEVKHAAGTVYTSTPGDYTTATYINIGYEVNGVRYYLKGSDISASNTVISIGRSFVVPPGGRVFFEFEATSTSQKYEVVVNGYMCDLEEEAESES